MSQFCSKLCLIQLTIIIMDFKIIKLCSCDRNFLVYEILSLIVTHEYNEVIVSILFPFRPPTSL